MMLVTTIYKSKKRILYCVNTRKLNKVSYTKLSILYMCYKLLRLRVKLKE